MNSINLVLTAPISHVDQLPSKGRVSWPDIAFLVGKPLDVWLSLSRRSYAPAAYAAACSDGEAYYFDVKEVRKYLADPKAYRAKAKPYAQLRYMWAGVLYDGYIPNTKTRKAMRLYSCKSNPKRAAQYFNQGYVFRNPDAVKVVKAKRPTPSKR